MTEGCFGNDELCSISSTVTNLTFSRCNARSSKKLTHTPDSLSGSNSD